MPITAETARECQAKAVQKRQQNVQNLKVACANLPQLHAIAIAVASRSTTVSGEPFLLERLARVRVQLDLLDKRITEQMLKPHPDGQLLNWLCQAQARLAEQQRQLAGWPLPGSLRPTGKPVTRSRGAPEPVSPEPAQIEPSCVVNTPTSGVPSAFADDSTPQDTESPSPQ